MYSVLYKNITFTPAGRDIPYLRLLNEEKLRKVLSEKRT